VLAQPQRFSLDAVGDAGGLVGAKSNDADGARLADVVEGGSSASVGITMSSNTLSGWLAVVCGQQWSKRWAGRSRGVGAS